MSIYKEVLGSDFYKLHPMMQQRFGLSAANRQCMTGRGTMELVWNAGIHTVPFLYMGTFRHIMFPETGTNIPFTIENYSYLDSFNRETVAWIRRFQFGKKVRCFDATMILSKNSKRIIDYLGTFQHLAVDIDIRADERGGIIIQSGPQRFYEGRLAFRYPAWLSGQATVQEYYDESAGLFRISVQVRNRYFGRLCGYHGWFRASFDTAAPEAIPAHIRPRREEIRE